MTIPLKIGLFAATVLLLIVIGCEERFNLGVLPDPGQSTVIGTRTMSRSSPPSEDLKARER